MADVAVPAPRADLPEPAERGRTVVADRVVTRIASIATAEIESVVDTRSGWTKLVRRGLPRAEAVVAGGTARITVEVAATWPTPLSALSARVREHVGRQVTDLAGVSVARVDVTVADVVHVESASRRVV